MGHSADSSITGQIDGLVGFEPAAATSGVRVDGSSYLSIDDKALLAQARAGQPRALRQFYDTYANQVRAHLYRLLGPDPDLDDVMQTVFVRAFRALDRFRGQSTIRTWLYRITTNTSHNLLRQRFRRDRVKAAFQWFNIGRGGHIQSPSRVDARDEASRMLRRLRPDLREVFVLYHYEGLTLQEISIVLERPISTVGDHLTRARKRLHHLAQTP